MCMESSAKLQYGSETTLDIPPDTVIAYSVTEMTIESDGYFGQWNLLYVAGEGSNSLIIIIIKCINYFSIHLCKLII